MATIVEVAKLAGVSVSTVSRVLNNSEHPVNAQTKSKVLEASSALNYLPSALAQALITKKTGVFGLIARDVLDPYFGAIVRGAEDAARSRGFLLIVCNSDRDPSKEIQYASTLMQHHVDGLIFAGGGLTEPSYVREMNSLIKVLREQGCAIVSTGLQRFPSLRVCNNETEALKAATRYLISVGHRRICYVSGPSITATSGLRFQGYKQALRESGLALQGELVLKGDFSTQSGLEAANRITEIRPLPTAVLASNDQMAVGCMIGLKRRGFRIPQEISIMGIDDITACEWVEPALTTVSLHMHQLGFQAIEYAMKLRNREINYDYSYLVPHELIIRNSVSPIKGRKLRPVVAGGGMNPKLDKKKQTK
jgi:LacI family transcriptional regulator